MGSNYIEIRAIAHDDQVISEIYDEIVLFMDAAFPEWRMESCENLDIFVNHIIEENGFLFSNSNINPVDRLVILYESMANTYKRLKNILL